MAAGSIQEKPTVAEKQQQEQPNKLKNEHHNLLYKAAMVAILFVILPLFPSQAPEFINQSALVTRNWELLHILFVGVAIAYGLFSRKINREDHNANASKFDNAQTLLSRFLQVSSFFDDDSEPTTPSELLSSDSDHNDTQLQTWSNKHHRNEPVVVVARSQQGNHHHSSLNNKVGEKPLLLPVRSLKSRLSDVSHHDDDGEDDDRNLNETSSMHLNRSTASKARSKSFSSTTNSCSIEGSGGGSFKMKDNNVVLPSPIPWRSRSGRFMEPNKQQVVETQACGPKQPSIEVPELINKVESRQPAKLSQNPRSSRKCPPPNKEIPRSSAESLAKNAEDLVRKKSFCKSCPPPPPPPPPMFYKPVSTRPRYGKGGDSFDKEMKRSFAGVGVGAVGKRGSQEISFMEEPTRKTNVEKERESSLLDKVVMESYDDDEDEDDSSSETEDEDVVGGTTMMQRESGKAQPVVEASRTDGASSGSAVGDEGPEVDKKADEFIAKFREQIRLQRIQSIKRSTRSARNSSSR